MTLISTERYILENPGTTENPAPPEQQPVTSAIEVPSELTQALDRVIGLAASDIAVFDRDLADGGWNAVPRVDALRAFLLAHRNTRLQIVVHETSHVEGHLPRLCLLLRDFGHKFSLLRTVDDARTVSDAFLIADGRHVVHRFHQDRFRGEMALFAPVKARQLHDRFDSILPFTEPGVNATLTGL